MLRRLLIGLSLLTISVACSKKDNTTSPGDTAADSNISSAPMSFSAQGSDSGAIQGLNTVFFGYDQSNLSSESKRVLNENATWIKTHPEVTMQLEGHCDERGSIEYNLALGEQRAKTAKSYLVSLGVEAKRITVISFGKEKKIADGDNEEAHGRNRRVNFVPLAN